MDLAGAATNTAFAGPWGVSFTANLTPDKETGLGSWTEEMFIATMRTGRHQGKGRPILPPMPVKMIGKATDEDLKSIFAYLQSLAPVKNKVPAPIDPAESTRRRSNDPRRRASPSSSSAWAGRARCWRRSAPRDVFRRSPARLRC